MWGGQNWGAIHIPRIGQEVIVLFLEGDPDRPIIVGGVYNPDQMPPYKLLITRPSAPPRAAAARTALPPISTSCVSRI